MDRTTPAAVLGIARSREIEPRGKRRLLAAKTADLLGRPPTRDVPIDVGTTTVFAGVESFDVDWSTLKQIFVMEEYAKASYDGATVLDLGANKGYFGAYALARGASTVHSLEPEPGNFSRLNRAVETCRSWTARQAAVAAHRGTVQLALDTAWTHSIVVSRFPGAQTLDVPAIPLEELLAAAGGGLLVKIDIEGAEREVLLATPADAWAGTNEVLIEVHEWAWTAAEAIRQMRSAGFSLIARNDVLHFSR